MPLRLVLIEDHQALREGLELLLVSGLDSGARGYALKEGTPAELTGAIAIALREGFINPPPELESTRT